MTATQERLTAMVPQIPSLAPRLSEDNAQTIINILISVQKQDDVDRKELARHRRELLAADKYVMSTGRTHAEIEADLKEMRSDRF